MLYQLSYVRAGRILAQAERATFAGAFKPPRHFAILDHDQGRHVLNREASDELGMLVAVDSLHGERPMVLPPLQDLSEEGLNPS